MDQLITVKNPNGNLGTIPESELNLALQNGFSIASNEEINKHNEFIEAGEHPVIAGVESGLSALTFGGSRELENLSGITTPEAQRLRQEANPLASGIGTVVGVAAPLLLTGGAAAPAAAGSVAASNAAKVGLGAADILNPVVATSKLGAMAGEAVAPMAGQIAAKLAPESPRIAAMIGKAGTGLVQGATEGALFGVGSAIDEHALGDTQAMGESLLHHVGLGAMLGGGLGSIFGGAGGLISGGIKKGVTSEGIKSAESMPTALDVVEQAGKKVDDFDTAAKLSTFEDTIKKDGVLSKFNELKPHATEIENAAKDLGVDVFEGQTRSSKDAQNLWYMLSKSPTYFGSQVREKLQNSFTKVSDLINNAVRSEGEESAAQVGQKIYDSIKKKADDMIDSYSAKFKEAGLTERAIPVNENSLKAITRNINKIPEVKGNIAPAFAQQMEGRLATVSTLEDLTTQIKALNADIYNFNIGANEKRIAIQIKDKLQNLYDNTIRKQFSKSDQKAMFDLYRGARKEFAESIGTLSEIGGAIGKKRIKSPVDFINFLEKDLNSDKLADALFRKNDSEFIERFSKKFPEEWSKVRDYQRSKIPVYKDNVLDINSTLKRIEKLTPEARAALYTPEEFKVLKSAKTWVDSFPKDPNPSGTAHVTGWMNFLENPVKATAAHARDFGIKTALNMGKVEASSIGTEKMGVFSKISEIAEKSKNLTKASADAIFSDKGKTASFAFGMKDISNEEFEKTMKRINETLNKYGQNENIEKNTEIAGKHAPMTTVAANAAMIRAAAFLNEKAPKAPSKALSQPYQPSKSELFKFDRYYKTIKNPHSVIKGIKSGMVLPEQMETLKTVYPSLLAEMQHAVMDKLTDVMAEGKKIPYQTKLGLSAFLETDLVNSLESQNIAMNQQNGAIQKQANQIKSTQSGLSEIALSNRLMSGTNKLTEGEA